MSLPSWCSVAIIGGGPAGSALAALLAAQGRRPVLLERDHFPRPKLCGEFLSMESQGLLARVGCLDEVKALCPAPLTRARFYTPSGREVAFDLGGQAWGLGRAAFDETLLRHAQRRGALAFEGATVTRLTRKPGCVELEVERRRPDGTFSKGRMRADLVVAAYGRRNQLDGALGRADAGRRSPFIGYKLRHEFRPGAQAAATRLYGAVEVHLFNGGYCGLSFGEDGSVNACLLAHERLLRETGAPTVRDLPLFLSRLSPSLRARFADLRPAGVPLAAAQLAFSLRTTGEGPVLFLGDAAGMIAPLCGDGQSMALEGAILLAELMESGDDATLARRWEKAWRRRFAARLRVGRGLQNLLMRPAVAEAAARAVGAWPALAAPLLAMTRGSTPRPAPLRYNAADAIRLDARPPARTTR